MRRKPRALRLILGLDQNASPAEAITRIDRFVCDIKESQFGDGLHIYGQAPGETEGLLTALAGRACQRWPLWQPMAGPHRCAAHRPQPLFR